MKYALIENGVVVNVIWLSPANAGDFSGVVALNGRAVSIGDTYADGTFYHGGDAVRSELEIVRAENEDMRAALALLGVTDRE